MKYSLPNNHCIPDGFLDRKEFLFTEDSQPSLTDIQWHALEAGICRGESILALAPTSTGKTQIGVWALTTWLVADKIRRRAIYLVTHRSLANQKFEEFQRILLNPLFEDNGDAIVLATGERQVNAKGIYVDHPLDANLLIATYEKYLGLLCASGIPTDLMNVCVIADEIQILGDEHRGVNIEILLTLVKKANAGQFIGLSAVISENNGRDLANWLRVSHVRVPHREKHLLYECRTSKWRLSFNTEMNSDISQNPINVEENSKIHEIITELVNGNYGKPIVVFCMRKQDVYDGCRKYCESSEIPLSDVEMLDILSDDTQEAELLSAIIPRRIAIHCADLVEEDRIVVEQAIKDGKIDLVFATSTLAAGVNFPIGTVLFYSWKRWNFDRRSREPISTGEFHNMAGRCGRMGTDHEHGHVIFLAEDDYRDQEAAKEFLNPDQLDDLESRINPEHFVPLVLQLAASNVVDNERDALDFLRSTFGASRELNANTAGLDHWNELFVKALSELREWGFLR